MTSITERLSSALADRYRIERELASLACHWAGSRFAPMSDAPGSTSPRGH